MVNHNGGKTRKNRNRKKTKVTRKNKSSQAKEPKCVAEELKEGVFGEDEFNSGDGMLTTVWGPSMWHFLHTMSFNYPVKPTCDDKQNYSNFIRSLKNILPCRYCRENLTRNLIITVI